MSERTLLETSKLVALLLGQVSYKMTEGQNIFDLIEEAGGYTQNAFPEGAIYLNEEAKEINKNATEKLYDEFIDGLIDILQNLLVKWISHHL